MFFKVLYKKPTTETGHFFSDSFCLVSVVDINQNQGDLKMSTPRVEKNIRTKVKLIGEDLRQKFPELTKHADEIDEKMKHEDIYLACGHAYDVTRQLVRVANSFSDEGEKAQFHLLYRVIQNYRKHLNKSKKFLGNN